MKLNKNSTVLSFSDIVGNKYQIKLIKGWLRNQTVPNAILFYGEGGTGKSTLAELLAMALLCENPTQEGPCLQCDSCKNNFNALVKGNHTDNLVKYNMATEGDISSLVKDIFILQSKSTKVYILEEMQVVSKKDQDKLLEEFKKLKDDSYVFYCTTEPWKLENTLRGRAFEIETLRPTTVECKKLIKNRGSGNLSSNGVYNLIQKSDRNPRKILNTLTALEAAGELNDQMVFDYFNTYESIDMIDFLETLNGSLIELLIFAEDVNNKRRFIYKFKEFVVDVILEMHTNSGKFSKTQRKRLTTLWDGMVGGSVRTLEIVKELSKLKVKDSIYSLLEIKFIFSSSNSRKEFEKKIKAEARVSNKTNSLLKEKEAEKDDVLVKLTLEELMTDEFGRE